MMARLKIDETIQQNGSCDFNKGFNDLAEELFVQNEVSSIIFSSNQLFSLKELPFYKSYQDINVLYFRCHGGKL